MKNGEILYALGLAILAGFVIYAETRKKKKTQTEDFLLGGFPSGIDDGSVGGGFGGGGGGGFYDAEEE